MSKDLDLERYVLKLKTVSEFARFLNVSIPEAKIKLVEQNAKPSWINKEKFSKLRKHKSMEQMAKYYNVPLSTLNKACAEQKVNKKLADISRGDLLKEVSEGKTIVELANKYEVSYATMKKYLNEYKIPIKIKRKRLNKNILKNLIKQKLDAKEIAKRLNCTIPAVRYYLETHYD